MTALLRPLPAALGYAVLLACLAVASVLLGSSGVEAGEVLEGALAMLGLAEPLERNSQAIVELRVWRALCTLGAPLRARLLRLAAARSHSPAA